MKSANILLFRNWLISFVFLGTVVAFSTFGLAIFYFRGKPIFLLAVFQDLINMIKSKLL